MRFRILILVVAAMGCESRIYTDLGDDTGPGTGGGADGDGGTGSDDTGGLGDDGPIDADGDGYNSIDDCDDRDEYINPDAPEICDEVDNDCNGVVDDDPTDGMNLWVDADGDGYGDPSSTSVKGCEPGSGLADNASDCDDADEDIHPGADEVCDDSKDNDCDRDVDEDCTKDWAKYTGDEFFKYGFDRRRGRLNCQLVWDAASTTASTFCPDCEWGFDVVMRYDRPSSTDDGTCSTLATDATYTYGYNPAYYGAPFLMMEYYGTAYGWVPASFDDTTGHFEYGGGFEDYPYYGYYYTMYWWGTATIE